MLQHYPSNLSVLFTKLEWYLNMYKEQFFCKYLLKVTTCLYFVVSWAMSISCPLLFIFVTYQYLRKVLHISPWTLSPLSSSYPSFSWIWSCTWTCESAFVMHSYSELVWARSPMRSLYYIAYAVLLQMSNWRPEWKIREISTLTTNMVILFTNLSTFILLAI